MIAIAFTPRLVASGIKPGQQVITNALVLQSTVEQWSNSQKATANHARGLSVSSDIVRRLTTNRGNHAGVLKGARGHSFEEAAAEASRDRC
jgi:hypothetical protein